MPDGKADTATEELAKSHLADAKAFKGKADCEAFDSVLVVLEDCVTHSMQARRDARETRATVMGLAKSVEGLPDKIIEKANGNADEIKLGLGGKTISGKASTILRFVIALGVAAIVLMMVVTELEKRNLIDAGGKTMVSDAIEQAVEDALKANETTRRHSNG